MDDAKLVAATLKGDLAAFEQLVRAYQSTIVSSAWQIIHHAEDAEDIAQETFLVAYRDLGKLREPDKFRPWLFSIMRHFCYRYLAKQRNVELPLDEVADILQAPAPEPDIENAALAQCLTEMPLSMREILIARYLYDLSYREIAQEFHINELAARVRCARARLQLRERMVKQEAEEHTLRKAMAGLTLAISPLFTQHVLEGIRAGMSMPLIPPSSTATAPAPGHLAHGWPGWHAAIHTAVGKAALILAGAIVITGGAVMLHHLHHHAQSHHTRLPQHTTIATASASSQGIAVKNTMNTASEKSKPATTSAGKIANASTGAVKSVARTTPTPAAHIPSPLPVKLSDEENAAVDLLAHHALHDAVIQVPTGTWHSSPALADLEGDGQLDIIAAVGEGWVGAWHADGRPVYGWPQPCGRICCSPAVGDVFHDGKLEIASPGHLWYADGQPVPGWPQGQGNCFCTPSLADLFGDGRLEILSTDIQQGVCVRRGDGSMLPGWPIAVPDNDVRSTPLAMDISGDGEKEIIFTRDEGEICVYHLDGTPFPGFPRRFNVPGQQNFVPVRLADNNGYQLMHGGKAIDLIRGTVTNLAGGWLGEAPCLLPDTATGHLLSLSPQIPEGAHYNNKHVSGSPGWYTDSAVAADIDGHGEPAVFFSNRDGGYHAVRNDGSELPGWPKRLTPGADSGMAVGDLYGDGSLEVVAPGDGGRIYVFDCAGSADKAAAWPLFMANNLRNGIPGAHPLPRARAGGAPLTAQAKALKQALTTGQWDTAIDLYQHAVQTIAANKRHFDARRAAQLQQAGLLSIARVLNTRSSRFVEAAEMYRRAIMQAPEDWSSCQALSECSDLVRLHPELPQAREALNGAVTACLPALAHLQIPEADLCRYAAAQACVQLGRSESLPLFQGLTTSASPCVAAMAKAYLPYAGLPFLLNLLFRQTYTVNATTRDLTPENMEATQVQTQLQVDPSTQTAEEFPMHLRVSTDFLPYTAQKDKWTKDAGGRYFQDFDRTLPNGNFNREDLLTGQESQQLLTVHRTVERIDARHERVKIYYQSPLKQIEYGFETRGTGARIDPTSVLPAKCNLYNNEGEVRFSYGCGCWSNSPSPANGVTIEATVELPAGMKCFYPEILVRAWGGGQEVNMQPHTATQRILGSYDGMRYDLSSPRPFKLQTSKTNLFYAFTMKKLDAE